MLLESLEPLPYCPLWILPDDQTTPSQTLLLKLPQGTTLLWLWGAPSVVLATQVETKDWLSRPHNPMSQKHLSKLWSLASIASSPMLLTDHSISPQIKPACDVCPSCLIQTDVVSGRDPTFCRAYKRCRNGLPGRTTFVACWSNPVRLWRPHLDKHLFETAAANSSFRRRSLSLGSLIYRVLVSTSIPRKVRHIAGPSSLDGSQGTPKWLGVSTRICLLVDASSSDWYEN